ncbi:MAG TPA: glycerophosphodiester phosphodiesterase family protein [Candidatus Didemnitutus sp.]|nr:glycerophosphodiester phosphodiesterase family protein [Candidatus Didemnitutus sp.]
MKSTRLLLLVAWLACGSLNLAFGQDKSAPVYQLIAHRGGVVEDKFPDNSLAALQAGAARKYRGIEVDIRETKDGVLIMQHDPDLKLNFGDPRKIFESNWADLASLHTPSGQKILTFEELVAAAKAHGLSLMLDSKDPHAPDFVGKVDAILTKYDMLGRCYIIGTSDAMDHFTGKALVGRRFRSLKQRVEADPAEKKGSFLFEEGRNLTEEMVRWAQAHGVEVIPSINAYHYYNPATMAGKSRAEIAPPILAAAERDVRKFQALGITIFQIDSEFDGWF